MYMNIFLHTYESRPIRYNFKFLLLVHSVSGPGCLSSGSVFVRVTKAAIVAVVFNFTIYFLIQIKYFSQEHENVNGSTLELKDLVPLLPRIYDQIFYLKAF